MAEPTCEWTDKQHFNRCQIIIRADPLTTIEVSCAEDGTCLENHGSRGMYSAWNWWDQIENRVWWLEQRAKMRGETAKRCANCAHGMQFGQVAVSCRRYPPTIKGDVADRTRFDSWPQVRPLEWCGEWVARQRAAGP